MGKTKELSNDTRDKICRPAQGWDGLQDHRQPAWWEGNNEEEILEEIQDDCQSPSD